MQGEIDTSVFSSLAFAFHQTSIPDLVRVANILQTKSKRHCGGTKSMNAAKKIVTENVKWLGPKRLPRTFNWEDEMNECMFVVGVIKDNTNSCQHAITIFRNWIYDSKEPFLALPPSKESLNCFTWEIKDGEIKNSSLFVCFIAG
jgi:isochorismate synthase EntC